MSAQPLQVILHDEVQFLDFGESRSAGPWIKLRLKEPEQLQAFRSLNPKECTVLNLTLSQGDIAPAEAEQPKAPYGAQANLLRKSGFFRMPLVWQAVGTDAEFLAWLRQQKCAACNAEAPSEAAHVRRIANGAGTGIKPEFSAIPLCSRDHRNQHQYGESKLFAKDGWDKLRIRYLEQWCWETVRAQIGVEHWNEAHPGKLREWAVDRGLGMHLPAGYVDA